MRRLSEPTGPILVRLVGNSIAAAMREGSDIRFCWISSHSGVRGNEIADGVAKQATRFPAIALKGLPVRDLREDCQRNLDFWSALC